MKTFILLLISFMFLTSCNKKDSVESSSGKEVVDEADKKAYIKNYATIVYATYEDAYKEALKLQGAVNDFVANPDKAKMEAAKKAWLAAREPYSLSEAFRFTGGPIDAEDGPEAALNAWPLDENYIDYGEGMPNAGVINNLKDFPEIKAEVLVSLNELDGEKNISLGYHAIEFLLWGQDDFDTKLKTPGNRPFTDYVEGGTAANHKRRGEYLKAVTEILVEDLKSLVDAWDPKGSDNYRVKFLSMNPDSALKNIMTGIGTLSKSELAGERIFVAISNQDQEDEHSCFSDNTHRDIILNALGIHNVISGTYKRTDGSEVKGKSLIDLIKIVDADLAAELDRMSRQSVKNTEAIPVPFDLALTSEAITGDGPIMTTVKGLQKQGDLISDAASVMGIKVGTDLPE